MEFIEWLGENEVPFSIVFTKIDKLSRSQLQKNLSHYKNHLQELWEELPPCFISSSETKAGREEILDYIYRINASCRITD